MGNGSVKSENPLKSVRKDFQPLFSTFRIFGIKGFLNEKMSKMKSVVTTIVYYGIVIFLLCESLTIFANPFKDELINVTFFLCNISEICLWFTLKTTKNNKVGISFKMIESILREHRYVLRLRRVRNVIIVFVSILIIAPLPLTLYSAYILTRTDNSTDYAFRKIVLNMEVLPHFTHLKKSLIYIYLVVLTCLFLIAPTLVTVLYAFQGLVLKRMLFSINIMLQRFHQAQFYDGNEGRMFSTLYGQITNAVKSMEDALSVPILFLMVHHILILFVTMATVLGVDGLNFLSETPFMALSATVCGASFSCIAWTASELLNAQNDLRHKALETAFRLHLNARFKDAAGELEKTITLNEVVPLTVGGLAKMNRSFSVSTWGMLLTYGLLVLQVTK